MAPIAVALCEAVILDPFKNVTSTNPAQAEEANSAGDKARTKPTLNAVAAVELGQNTASLPTEYFAALIVPPVSELARVGLSVNTRRPHTAQPERIAHEVFSVESNSSYSGAVFGSARRSARRHALFRTVV